MGSRKRLSNTTRKHELESRNREPWKVRLGHGSRQGLPGTASTLVKPGHGQKEGLCKRRRPSRHRRLAAILATALQGCVQQEEAGARHRQVHPASATRTRFPAARQGPPGRTTARGGGLPPQHPGDVGAGLAKYLPKMPSMPPFGLPVQGVIPSLRAFRAAQPVCGLGRQCV